MTCYLEILVLLGASLRGWYSEHSQSRKRKRSRSNKHPCGISRERGIVRGTADTKKSSTFLLTSVLIRCSLPGNSIPSSFSEEFYDRKLAESGEGLEPGLGSVPAAAMELGTSADSEK